MKKKIAVIGLKGLPPFGGTANVGERLINQLKDKYDISVLSVASHADKKTTMYNGVKQIVFSNYGKGGINTLLYYLRSLLHVWFNNYDVIHLHHAVSGFITPLLKLNSKVVVTFHGVSRGKDPKFSKLQNRFFRFSEKLNVFNADYVVSVSKPDKEYIKKKYGRDILYIPNGIDKQFMDNRLDSIIEKTNNYIFFAAGRIYQIKGLHLLLEALKIIESKEKLYVAGDLGQVKEYGNFIKETALGLDVKYLGLIKDKKKLNETIKNAKFFVFPSLTEAMSMMLLEVASLKTPLIVSDIDANKAVFNSNEVLFFKTDNSKSLAEKIEFANRYPKKMEEMANNAYSKLISKYTWETIALQYDNIFNSIVKK
jgi:glycosyltransferase involved in cell wall biosynthesis